MSRQPGLGVVARVNQPTALARAKVSTGQSVSTTQPCDFDDVELDPYGIITTGSSWKATAPFACYCWVSATMYSASGATIRIYKNGSYATSLDTFSVVSLGSGSTLIELVAGDYIDVRTDNSITTSSDGLLVHVSIEMTARL